LRNPQGLGILSIYEGLRSTFTGPIPPFFEPPRAFARDRASQASQRPAASRERPGLWASSARIGQTTRQIPSAVDASARWQTTERHCRSGSVTSRRVGPRGPMDALAARRGPPMCVGTPLVHYSDVPGGFASPVLCGTKRWRAGTREGQGYHAAFCHQCRYLDGAACGCRMYRSHARSLHEVRRADLAVSPASRRSGVLP
jgi:hypothetical protein